jgi:TonB family protein
MIAVILEAAVRSSVLILVVWTALALIRLRNPHRLKALWTSVVVASLSMPLLMQLHVAPAVVAPILHWTVQPGTDGLTHTSSLRGLGLFVYAVPSLLLLGRFTFGWSRLRRIRRESQSLLAPWADGFDVRVSERISSPSTFGMTILLPEECSTWGRPKLAAVMAHERAHVVHRDCYVLWLARLNAIIFWFNPLAWCVARRLAALAEQTSDEAAVENLGNRADYAEILLGLRMQRPSELTTAMASSDLPARIERILSDVTLSPAIKRPQLFLMVSALLPAVALAAAPLELTGTSSESASQAPASVTGATSSEPKVLSGIPLASYYPREAMHKGIEGMVELAITLDSAGRATDTQILTEDPLNMGFGAAASEAAHVMTYSNPTHQPVTFTLRFDFKISSAPATKDHAVDSSSTPEGG